MKSWKPQRLFQGGGQEQSHTNSQASPETKSTVDSGLSRTAYSGYKLEFQSTLPSYELILHPPGLSDPLRIFMYTVDLPLRKMQSDTPKVARSSLCHKSPSQKSCS